MTDNNLTSVQDSTEQPSTEVDSTVEVQGSETNTVNEQPATETGNEDSFFDPKSVPAELLPAYKQMQSAFTKKTQEIAEARKAAEALKADAEAYTKYKQYIPIVEEMMQGKKGVQQSPELEGLVQQLKEAGYSDEAIDMMKMSGSFFLNHFNQNLEARERNNWVNNQISEAAKVDERLNDPNLVYKTDDGQTVTYGQLVEKIVASDQSWVQNPIEATKKAVKIVDALIGQAKTQGKEELSTSAKAKALKFPKETSSPARAVQSDRIMTVQEAAEEAKKELGM